MRLSLLFLVCVILGACAGRPEVPRPARALPRFEDALLGEPSVAIVLRPRELLRDKVYGPLLARATSLAEVGSIMPSAGATALIAFERTDEVDVVLWGGPNNALVALRGVPADLDATRIVDSEGQSLWQKAAHAASGVDELLSVADPAAASLFVLSARTWVIAVGAAVDRARRAYALPGQPSPHASIEVEGDALASVILSGEAMQHAVPRLGSGQLAPLGHELNRAAVWLAPGRQGVFVVRLSYASEASARTAEQTASAVVEAVRSSLQAEIAHDPSAPPDVSSPQPGRSLLTFGFLAAAGVQRTGQDLTVRAPIPSHWLAAIAQADLPRLDAPDGAALPRPKARSRTMGTLGPPDTAPPRLQPEQKPRPPLTDLTP
jgi:hypothetical protein